MLNSLTMQLSHSCASQMLLPSIVSFSKQRRQAAVSWSSEIFSRANSSSLLLPFYMNDTEVAYLSNNKLYVTQAEILTKLIIGKFAFVPQTNGNMSIVYNG